MTKYSPSKELEREELLERIYNFGDEINNFRQDVLDMEQDNSEKESLEKGDLRYLEVKLKQYKDISKKYNTVSSGYQLKDISLNKTDPLQTINNLSDNCKKFDFFNNKEPNEEQNLFKFSFLLHKFKLSYLDAAEQDFNREAEIIIDTANDISIFSDNTSIKDNLRDFFTKYQAFESNNELTKEIFESDFFDLNLSISNIIKPEIKSNTKWVDTEEPLNNNDLNNETASNSKDVRFKENVTFRREEYEEKPSSFPSPVLLAGAAILTTGAISLAKSKNDKYHIQ